MNTKTVSAFHSEYQHTLTKPVTMSGIGLHSGATVHLMIEPAAENTGILFIRGDIAVNNLIAASALNVTETKLGTTLANAQGVSVATVEHLMAALWGMGIDNARVTVSGPEIPILDGSSQPFLRAFTAAGLRKQTASRHFIKITRPLELEMGDSSLRIEPSTGFTLEIDIDYDHHRIARQRAFYDFESESFEDALAEARTFGFLHEVEYLKKMGLARGGSLENAVVLSETDILNPEGLRSPDEFVRHKALDCVGDLFLAGYRLLGAVQADKPGHTINTALAKQILTTPAAWELVTRPQRLSTTPMPMRALSTEAAFV